MSTNQSKLEQLCDMVTENIINDVEHAKYIIAEAGYESNVSDVESKRKIKYIQEAAFKKLKEEMIAKLTEVNLDLYKSNDINYTVFNISDMHINLCVKIHGVDKYKNISNCPLSNTVDEEKLQLN